MSILVNRNTRVVAQGITGTFGRYHTARMLEYGTRIVAGVTPGRGGSTVNGVPVYDTVAEAVRHGGADAAITFVPGPYTAQAIAEDLEAGIPLVAAVVEGVPVRDMMLLMPLIRDCGATVIGPNSPGLLSTDGCSIGFLPGSIYMPGPVGLVSRSGTFSYAVAHALTLAGLGQTTCVGIGGDPITGVGFVDMLERFEADPQTEAIVLVGEIGRSCEEEAAEYIAAHVSKPVVAIIAGRTAPEGKAMGHAGAIISGGRGSYASKEQALQGAGVPVARTPEEVALRVGEALGRKP
ncbi:MAG: succinate--CoA ligase subunit alpha [Deferrisomatales bacterium]|nr:succinate--CoA ligase subunit alpha [Deferrisomatales bacterium]